MFENMSEKEAHDKILKMVREYCAIFHQKKNFKEGDRIPYASRVYNHEEIENLVDSALEFWLTSGRYTAEFEKNWRNIWGYVIAALSIQVLLLIY